MFTILLGIKEKKKTKPTSPNMLSSYISFDFLIKYVTGFTQTFGFFTEVVISYME